MTAAAFDTLSTARDLEAAGIARTHAEAIAQAINHGDEGGHRFARIRNQYQIRYTRIRNQYQIRRIRVRNRCQIRHP